MKKSFLCILTAILILSCLTACNWFGNKGVTLKEYENCAVFTFADFPKRKTASFTLSRTGLDEGAIYYQVNLEAGALRINYKDAGFVHSEQPLGEFSADDEMPVSGSGGYIEGDKITIIFDSDSPIIGEIIIAFTEDALKAVHGNLHLHTHTYSYTSAGKVGHFTTSTCGCPSEEGTTPHYDENTDYRCDFCKCDMTEFADEWQHDETHHWYVSDDAAVYCYGEHQNFDADLNCDVCGYKMSEIPTPTNHFLRNQTGCEWLNEINAEDIAKIKIISEAVGVAPGNLKLVSSSADEAVMARIFEEYYWLDTAPISKMEGQIAGGSAVTVKFILKDETEKTLYINNGNYLDTNGNYFELHSTPRFKDTDRATTVYGFITYIDTGAVYPGDFGTIPEQEPQPLCIIDGIGDMECISIDKKPDQLPEMPLYQIETEFGVLDIYGPYNFAFDGTHYLRVDGGNFLAIIEDARNAEISR